MTGPNTADGYHKQTTKKQFCRMIKQGFSNLLVQFSHLLGGNLFFFLAAFFADFFCRLLLSGLFHHSFPHHRSLAHSLAGRSAGAPTVLQNLETWAFETFSSDLEITFASPWLAKDSEDDLFFDSFACGTPSD